MAVDKDKIGRYGFKLWILPKKYSITASFKTAKAKIKNKGEGLTLSKINFPFREAELFGIT